MVTSRFHELTAALEDEDGRLPEAERARLQAELKRLGGRKRYQEASILLTGINKSSSKWVFKNLTELGLRPSKGQAPLRTLEVGAINTQLLNCPWLDVLAIDIKSRHPQIKEMDFFDLDTKQRFDVLSNAMVLNCVPTPQQRGEMMLRCAHMLNQGGLLSLVLPLRWAEAVGKDRLQSLMGMLGLDTVAINESPKIFFMALRKSSSCWHKSASFRPEALAGLLKRSAAIIQVTPTSLLQDLCTCQPLIPRSRVVTESSKLPFCKAPSQEQD